MWKKSSEWRTLYHWQLHITEIRYSKHSWNFEKHLLTVLYIACNSTRHITHTCAGGLHVYERVQHLWSLCILKATVSTRILFFLSDVFAYNADTTSRTTCASWENEVTPPLVMSFCHKHRSKEKLTEAELTISVLVLKVKLYNMSHSWINEMLIYLILDTALSVSSGLAQGEAFPMVKLWSA